MRICPISSHEPIKSRQELPGSVTPLVVGEFAQGLLVPVILRMPADCGNPSLALTLQHFARASDPSSIRCILKLYAIL